MGLLDKLIKEGAEALKDVASEENKKKAQELFGSLKEGLEEHKEDLKKALDEIKEEYGVQETSKPSSTSSYEKYFPEDYDSDTDPRSCREKILAVLADEFPRYDVRENVSPAEIGGTGRFMNYSIGVYDGREPNLFIMIIGKTTTAHREYRWSRQEAEKRGYTFLNFVEHFPNLPEYISERLHKYL